MSEQVGLASLDVIYKEMYLAWENKELQRYLLNCLPLIDRFAEPDLAEQLFADASAMAVHILDMVKAMHDHNVALQISDLEIIAKPFAELIVEITQKVKNNPAALHQTVTD